MNINIKQKVGEHFDLHKMYYARDKTFAAVHAIAEQIKPGMTELEARELAKKTLAQMGMDRIWHQILIRFGANTLKKFNEPSEGNPTLQTNDIFFIDLGVVWDGHEGDAGATFTVGDDSEMSACAQACKTIYEEVETHWRKTRCSGKALYDFAEKIAAKHGWQLNVEIRGHRVSDFPHAIYKAGDWGDFVDVPEAGLWILEIQIQHPSKPYGAFYEDLLMA